MLFLTFMLTISPDGSQVLEIGAYNGAMACGDALLTVQLDEGWSGHCDKTHLISQSPRPKSKGD